MFAYIAKDNAQAAHRVRQAIFATIALVAARPRIGIRNARAPELRSHLVAHYPYRVHYSIGDEEIIILHVRHGARRPLP
ncbi:MAG: type II toxin-antitoxin system RelE/ParE family toxin [Pseudolabrys sp.]